MQKKIVYRFGLEGFFSSFIHAWMPFTSNGTAAVGFHRLGTAFTFGSALLGAGS